MRQPTAVGMRALLALVVVLLVPVRVSRAQCGDVPTFADALSPVRELHVAPPPLGSNSTGDGSAARPFATIAFGASRATPGTAVRVHPGVYSGGNFIESLRGSAAAPIWIGGVPGGARPVIDGATEGLHLVRCSYVVVHDLEVRNATGNGVNSDDGGEYSDPTAAHHQVFRGLFIHDIGGSGNQDGLKLSGLNDFVVVDCEVTRCGGAMSGSGIDMVGCHRGTIARCSMHDLSANAVQAKGGTVDVEIRWCRMENAGERALNIGGSTGFGFFRPPLSEKEPNAEARDIRAIANVIIGSNASVAFVGATGCVFAQNTIVDPRRWVARILQETVSTGAYTFDPCSNNTFSGNLVYFDRSALSTFVNVGPNTSPQSFVFRNDLWYAHDNPAASTPVLPVAETGGVVGVDPRLRDPARADYSLCTKSPAAGRGGSPAPIAGDIRGFCYADPPAIGAYAAPVGRLADFNGDGVLNSQDFFDFLAALFGGDPRSDFNADGAIDSRDFFAFLGAYFAGC